MLPYSGGSPERIVFTSSEVKGSAYERVEDKLVALQRRIGVKSCEFVATIGFTNPFSLVSRGDLMGKISEKAILRATGVTDLSTFPSYDELFIEGDRAQIRTYMETYAPDQKFKSGVNFMREWIIALRQAIEGKIDYRSRPDSMFTVLGVYVPNSTLDYHLSLNPTGVSLIEELGYYSQRNFSYNQQIRAEGIRFGIDLFVTAASEYAGQMEPEFFRLHHELEFLKQADALVARFRYVPFDSRIR